MATVTINKIALLQICARVAAAAFVTPARLTINGTSLFEPSGSAIRLQGFNWQLGRTTTADGALMKKLIPEANVARLVGIFWDNSDPKSGHPTSDCMTQTPPHYFDDSCFKTLDPWVKTATDAGLWVILAVRSQVGAGQYFDTDPGSCVFHNTTLKNMLFAAWTHIAQHYASFDNIAAYEILSEPRDKTISSQAVRDFYQGGCLAARAGDPTAPCMIGNAPYYKLWKFKANQVGLLDKTIPVIYTFDYFTPDNFVFGKSSVPVYGKQYKCKELADGWVDAACPNKDGDAMQALDKNWTRTQFVEFAIATQQQLNAPVFINQWEAVHGITSTNSTSGALQYVEDVASLAQEYNLGWAWWTWAGGNSAGWSHGSSEIVFRFGNGTEMYDTEVLNALQKYMKNL